MGKLRIALALLLTGAVLVVLPAFGIASRQKVMMCCGAPIGKTTWMAAGDAMCMYWRGAFDFMNDTKGGRDRMYGGDGDTLAGGPGADVLNGGRSQDRLYGWVLMGAYGVREHH